MKGKGTTLFYGFFIILICLFYVLGFDFCIGSECIIINVYGFGFIVIISLTLGIIQESGFLNNSKLPVNLWSIGHLTIPIFIVLLSYLYFGVVFIALIIGIITVIGWEIFELTGRTFNTNADIVEESSLNTIIDLILDSIGIIIGIWMIV